MKSGHIVVVAVRDAASGQLALQRAISFAPTAQDRIHLIHVSRMAVLRRMLERLDAHWAPPERESADAGHGWLKELAESVGQAGPKVDFQVLSGSPGPAIAEFAREASADLIVLATHREGQVREVFLGSTAGHVLRRAPCPVVVARGRVVSPYQRALVAIDLDESGARVEAAARTWLAGVERTLLHAYRLPQEGQMRMRGVTEGEIGTLRGIARADLEERFKANRLVFPQPVAMVHGYPADVIFEQVLRERPDILVLGMHRGSPTQERVMGSVTQFLIYASPTDLLLVP